MSRLRALRSTITLAGVIALIGVVAASSPAEAQLSPQVCVDCDMAGDCAGTLSGEMECEEEGGLFSPCIAGGGECHSILWCIFIPWHQDCALYDSSGPAGPLVDSGRRTDQAGIDGYTSPRIVAAFASGTYQRNSATYYTGCSGMVLAMRYEPVDALAVRRQLAVVRT